MTNLGRNIYLDLATSGSRILRDAGKALAHATSPNDFEYYLIAIELENAVTEEITDRFIFPVNPNSINITETKTTTVQKTSGGVSSLTNNTFTPMPISINGTFGRRFRLLSGNKFTKEKGESKLYYIDQIKTGYGSLKLLERIFRKSNNLASGKPYRVYFYNLAFNEVYLVKMIDFNHGMNVDQNMMWQYTLQMTAIADVSKKIGGYAAPRDIIGANIISKEINKVTVGISNTFLNV